MQNKGVLFQPLPDSPHQTPSFSVFTVISDITMEIQNNNFHNSHFPKNNGKDITKHGKPYAATVVNRNTTNGSQTEIRGYGAGPFITMV